MASFLSSVEQAPALLKELFPLFFRNPHHRHEAVSRAAARPISPPVLAALRSQNPNSPSLARLEAPCAMVVTGQQLGVLGGPLFTLYKIASAVSLSRLLEKETGIPVIPTFWLQSEDHDFEEVRSAQLLGANHELCSVALPPTPAGLGGSVGQIIVDAASASSFAELIHRHFDGRAQPVDIGVLLEAYRSGASLADALATFVRHYFADEGLLVFDAHQPPIKSHALGFLESFFTRSVDIEQALVERESLLATHGLAATVPIRKEHPLPFVEFEGKRERLKVSEGGQYRSSKGLISWNTLRELLAARPERCSTSALMRPLFQDFLLPTAAYVAGPSELSYWGQISGLYRLLGLSMPMVAPRAHCALLTSKLASLLEQEKLCIEDLAKSDQELVLTRLTAQSSPDTLFGAAEQSVSSLVDQLTKAITPLGHEQLTEGLSLTKAAMLANLSKLKGRYSRALTERESAFTARAARLRALLYPAGQPQERVVASAQFTLLEGKSGIARLISLISPLEDSAIKPYVLSA